MECAKIWYLTCHKPECGGYASLTRGGLSYCLIWSRFRLLSVWPRLQVHLHSTIFFLINKIWSGSVEATCWNWISTLLYAVTRFTLSCTLPGRPNLYLCFVTRIEKEWKCLRRKLMKNHPRWVWVMLRDCDKYLSELFMIWPLANIQVVLKSLPRL